MVLLCGIPSVTLLGDASDWDSILQRLDKLVTFGLNHQQLTDWKNLLAPVIQNMVQCFHEPETQADFWSKIAHYQGGGSGPTYLSGWITAFCVFSEKGNWQAGKGATPSMFGPGDDGPPLSLQDSRSLKTISYPVIDSQDVPPGCCEVDVKIELALPWVQGVAKAIMVAGLAGASVFPKSLDQDVLVLDTVQPFPAWWIFTIDEDAKNLEEEREGALGGRGQEPVEDGESAVGARGESGECGESHGRSSRPKSSSSLRIRAWLRKLFK